MDTSLARALSRQSLKTWLAAGNTLEQALKDWCTQAHTHIRHGRPLAKVAQQALTQLAPVLASSPLPAPLQPLGARRHEALVPFAQACEDTVQFTQARCSIHGRTGVVLQFCPMLTISLHALERLHQRLDTFDAQAVLQELHSGLQMAPTMNEAAETTGAKHWPLLTEQGLGVCVPSERFNGNMLVTWMRFDHLGKKWGQVADDLRAARASNPALLQDPAFCAEVLRLYAWLLKPHSPAADLGALWWSARSQPPGAQDRALQDLEAALTANDASTAQTNDELDAAGQFAPGDADHVLAGNPPLDALDETASSPSCTPARTPVHALRPHTCFEGIVVQTRPNGSCVVGLQNGSFGMMPAHTDDDWPKPPPPLGARLMVEVIRIFDRTDPRPLAILLHPAQVVAAKWQRTQQQYPVGELVEARVVWAGSHGAVLTLNDGTSGWLPKPELSWQAIACKGIAAGLSRDQVLQVRVIGHADAHKRLVLSLRQVQPPPPHFEQVEQAEQAFSVGSTVQARVVWLKHSGGIVVQMPNGQSGWLSNKELSWVRDNEASMRAALQLEQQLTLQVTGYDVRRQSFVLSLRALTPHPLDALCDTQFVGTEHLGTVTKVVDYGVFVRLPLGCDGLLHRSDWPAELALASGDAVRVRVSRFDKAARRIGLQLSPASPAAAANAAPANPDKAEHGVLATDLALPTWLPQGQASPSHETLSELLPTLPIAANTPVDASLNHQAPLCHPPREQLTRSA